VLSKAEEIILVGVCIYIPLSQIVELCIVVRFNVCSSLIVYRSSLLSVRSSILLNALNTSNDS
jgi:hypothetical protein